MTMKNSDLIICTGRCVMCSLSLLFSTTGITWGALKMLMPGPHPQNSYLVGPSCSLEMGIFKSSPGDLNVQPVSRTTILVHHESKLLYNRECFPLAALKLVQMLVYLQVMVLFEEHYKIWMYLIDSCK